MIELWKHGDNIVVVALLKGTLELGLRGFQKAKLIFKVRRELYRTYRVVSLFIFSSKLLLPQTLRSCSFRALELASLKRYLYRHLQERWIDSNLSMLDFSQLNCVDNCAVCINSDAIAGCPFTPSGISFNPESPYLFSKGCHTPLFV